MEEEKNRLGGDNGWEVCTRSNVDYLCDLFENKEIVDFDYSIGRILEILEVINCSMNADHAWNIDLSDRAD